MALGPPNTTNNKSGIAMRHKGTRGIKLLGAFNEMMPTSQKTAQGKRKHNRKRGKKERGSRRRRNTCDQENQRQEIPTKKRVTGAFCRAQERPAALKKKKRTGRQVTFG